MDASRTVDEPGRYKSHVANSLNTQPSHRQTCCRSVYWKTRKQSRNENVTVNKKSFTVWPSLRQFHITMVECFSCGTCTGSISSEFVSSFHVFQYNVNVSCLTVKSLGKVRCVLVLARCTVGSSKCELSGVFLDVSLYLVFLFVFLTAMNVLACVDFPCILKKNYPKPHWIYVPLLLWKFAAIFFCAVALRPQPAEEEVKVVGEQGEGGGGGNGLIWRRYLKTSVWIPNDFMSCNGVTTKLLCWDRL